MKEQYHLLTKQDLGNFPFQQSPKPIVPVEPDLLLEMTFSPKLFIISDIASEVEKLVVHGVEWLDARVDCSPSQPSDDEIKVYEDYRMPYIHQTYKLTDKESLGESAKARAMPTRCFMPFDMAAAPRSMASARPTRSR